VVRKAFLTFLRGLLLAAFFCLPLVQPARGQSRTLRFENLSVEDGLSQSTVQAILQDSHGFMWFGTEDGLNKYDGYTFTIYKHDPDNPFTISDNDILTLFEDSRGMLWVGTGRGLNRFDPVSETFLRYLHDPQNPLSLNGSTVTAILEDPAGNIWAGTEDGLNRLNAADDTFVHYQHYPDRPMSLGSNLITALILDPPGGMWVGTSDGLDYYNFATNQFTHYRSDLRNPRSLSSNKILSLWLDRYGLLWVGTEDGGLNRFNATDKTFTSYKSRAGNPYALVSNDIRTIFEDSKGRLWVGTRKALHRLERREDYFIHYLHDPKDSHSLSSSYILSLYEDRSGVFWIGTFSGGVNKYNQTDDRFILHQYQPGVTNSLSDNMVHAIFEDQDGVVWVGTMDGGLNRYDAETQSFKAYIHNPLDTSTLGSNDVRAILEDRSGALWVGTYGGGLNRFNPDTGRFTRFLHNANNPYSLSDDRVLSLLEDHRGVLWIGTQAGGLDLLDRSTLRFHHLQFGGRETAGSEDPVRAIYQAKDRSLWIGTNHGIYVLNPETLEYRHYFNDPKDSNSLSSDRVLSFYESPDGVMWIGTIQGGLNRFDPALETFRRYTQKHGLPNDSVFGILPDHEGNLWLSTNMGLSRFDPATERFRNFDVRDGLQGNEFNVGAYFRNKRGILYFGGVHGFNLFDPRSMADNLVPPPVVITAFKKFNQIERKDLAENELIVLSYQDNFISFEFAALDYSTPDKNQYAYKLEGFDRDWVYAGTRRYTSYTNLKGGDYVFRVKGANKDGIWNEAGTSVRIHVIPPVWEQWWFNGAMVFLFVSSAVGAFWLRVKRIQEQQARLEEQVRERTAQIERSAAEIERRRQVAEGLREILAILNSNMSLRECLDHITHQAIRLMDASAVVIFRRGEGNLPVVVAYNLPGSRLDPGPNSPFSTGSNMPVVFTPEWLCNPVLAGQTMILQDVAAFIAASNAAHPGSIPSLDPGGNFGPARRWENILLQDYRAMLAVPLILNEEVDGGLLLAYEQPRLISEEDQQTAAGFADHAALAIANARLRSQAEELAVSSERSRLARDLHDAVTQTLFATSLIADVLPRLWERNPEAGRQKLAEVRELTRGALAEMRTLLMELRPAALEDVPLPDLLQQLSEAFTGRARVPVDLNLDRTINLPPNVKIGFYRIAQEALNNISKHARASQVQIHLVQENGHVQMLISDNGIGFDLHKNNLPDHFGLGIMEERAQSVGAAYTIQSQVGSGTQIRVAWEAEPETRQVR